MQCSSNISTTLQTGILSTDTLDSLKQVIFLKSLNSVFFCVYHFMASIVFPTFRRGVSLFLICISDICVTDIKLIRGKSFPDRYLFPMAAY